MLRHAGKIALVLVLGFAVGTAANAVMINNGLGAERARDALDTYKASLQPDYVPLTPEQATARCGALVAPNVLPTTLVYAAAPDVDATGIEGRMLVHTGGVPVARVDVYMPDTIYLDGGTSPAPQMERRQIPIIKGSRDVQLVALRCTATGGTDVTRAADTRWSATPPDDRLTRGGTASLDFTTGVLALRDIHVAYLNVRACAPAERKRKGWRVEYRCQPPDIPAQYAGDVSDSAWVPVGQ